MFVGVCVGGWVGPVDWPGFPDGESPGKANIPGICTAVASRTAERWHVTNDNTQGVLGRENQLEVAGPPPPPPNKKDLTAPVTMPRPR